MTSPARAQVHRLGLVRRLARWLIRAAGREWLAEEIGQEMALVFRRLEDGRLELIANHEISFPGKLHVLIQVLPGVTHCLAPVDQELLQAARATAPEWPLPKARAAR